MEYIALIKNKCNPKSKAVQSPQQLAHCLDQKIKKKSVFFMAPD